MSASTPRHSPLVSVVIATWNRSGMLRHALRSLQASTLEDWEAVVVGDHCTDDTEAVVRALDDPRIRFTNLAENSGQQATPNNVGVTLARGRYLAFLNHDDLYLPDHLRRSVDLLERGTADGPVDLLLSTYLVVLKGYQAQALNFGEGLSTYVCGHEAGGTFDPEEWHVASSWVMRREVADRVGPWRTEARVVVTPSQEWLFRAWRRGVRIHCAPEAGVVVIPSGPRLGSYNTDDFGEHARVFDALVASGVDVSGAAAAHLAAPAPPPAAPSFKRRLHRLLQQAQMRLGVHPNTLRYLLTYGGRGAYVRQVAERTRRR